MTQRNHHTLRVRGALALEKVEKGVARLSGVRLDACGARSAFDQAPCDSVGDARVREVATRGIEGREISGAEKPEDVLEALQFGDVLDVRSLKSLDGRLRTCLWWNVLESVLTQMPRQPG
jgi:hypothetical protein